MLSPRWMKNKILIRNCDLEIICLKHKAMKTGAFALRTIWFLSVKIMPIVDGFYEL